jgi:RNA polymerase sigma-70 factor (ECF subfamily)
MKREFQVLSENETRLFEELMTFREDVFKICLGFSRNPADAEDLAQDVYLKAYRNIKTVHSPYAIKEWLFRIARNTCLDHKKKGHVAQLFDRLSNLSEVVENNMPETGVEISERLAILKNAVERLPKKQREVFVLREYGHLSYDELARTVGIRTGTVMSRLNRARKTVATFMNEAGHGK